MRTIYRDASQAALILLGEPTQPKEQNQTADQAKSTSRPRPNQRAAQKSAKKPICQCPYCVYERNERRTRFQEPARDDTIVPGTYVDYLLKNNYEWSPCGRRMQPSNSISFKPEDEYEYEYEYEDEDEYED